MHFTTVANCHLCFTNIIAFLSTTGGTTNKGSNVNEEKARVKERQWQGYKFDSTVHKINMETPRVFPTIQICNKKNIEVVFRMYFNQYMEIKAGTLYAKNTRREYNV